MPTPRFPRVPWHSTPSEVEGQTNSDVAGRARRQAKSRSTRAAVYRQLVEDSDDGMILADEQAHILYANTSSERFLGYPPSELIGRIGFELCRPEHLPIAHEGFTRCLAAPGRPVEFEVDVGQRAGGFRSLAVKLINRIPTPGVNAVVVHFRDVVPEKSVPVDVSHGGAYRDLFENAPVGMGVADMEGNLLAFNNAILQPGGYTREDIFEIGNVGLLYATPAERERVLAIAQAQGFVWREEVQFRRKDGSFYDTLLTLTPVRFEGRQCWYAMVEDITERRRAEREHQRLEGELRQAQKMEAVGRMTGGIAHDFNNVLSIIIANADLIGAVLPPGDTETRSDLAELKHAADRGAAMIRKLLGFSRHAELKPIPTDMADLLNRLRGMLRHLIPESIQLEVTAEPGTAAVADPVAVEQMVLNLATNARDAMQTGGTVRIHAASVMLDRGEAGVRTWMPSGEFVRVSVTDTGTGMDEATRTRALEPFFTTKPIGVGTGLGLSMVYGLVKQQRGYIDISSELGKGTTVNLYFPRATSGVVAPPSRSPSATRGGDARILLIEDDESLRATTRRVLERLGYRVLVAKDGEEGLALYRQNRDQIDLVLSDTVMPGMMGTDVYEAIRRDNPAVRFVLASGYDEREVRTFQIPESLTLFRKPWTIEELASRIREALAE